MGTLLDRLLEPGLSQRPRGKLRRESWPDTPLACEALEARAVIPELRQVSLPSTIQSANYAFLDCPKLQILSGPATAPRNLQATLVAGNRVQLNWQSPLLAREQSIDVRRYKVEYSVNGGKTWQAAVNVPGKLTSVTLPALYGRRTYVFRLTPVAGFPYAAPYNTNQTVPGQSVSTTITVPGRSLFRV